MREMSDSEQENVTPVNVTQLETLEMAFLTVFWNTILETMQRTSVQIPQNSLMNLHTGTKLLKYLISFLEEKRNSFEEFVENAKKIKGVSKQ